MSASAHIAQETEAEIRAEERQLLKADADISAGRIRLAGQQRLLAGLAASSPALHEAERLSTLLQDNLVVWERHRALIVQRLTYLHERRRREAQA